MSGKKERRVTNTVINKRTNEAEIQTSHSLWLFNPIQFAHALFRARSLRVYVWLCLFITFFWWERFFTLFTPSMISLSCLCLCLGLSVPNWVKCKQQNCVNSLFSVRARSLSSILYCASKSFFHACKLNVCVFASAAHSFHAIAPFKRGQKCHILYIYKSYDCFRCARSLAWFN